MTDKKIDLTFRNPTPDDGHAIWQLIQACPPLDVNSCYSYLLLSAHFSDTCVVAEAEGKILGYVSGYIPPKKPDVLFIWQVAVSSEARGLGLAKRMIQHLQEAVKGDGVQYLETTITPSNEASQRLFQSLARSWDTECVKSSFFTAEQFGGESHEPEECYRIGPWQ